MSMGTKPDRVAASERRLQQKKLQDATFMWLIRYVIFVSTNFMAIKLDSVMAYDIGIRLPFTKSEHSSIRSSS